MPDPRVGFTLFCDSLRAEVGNKYSLMGIYGEDLCFTSNPPAALPTFCIVAILITDIDDRPTEVAVRIVLPDKTELFKSQLPVAQTVRDRPGSTKIHLKSITQINGMTFTTAGDLEVYFDTERGPLRVGRLSIKFMPAETPAPVVPTSSTEHASSAQQSADVAPPKARPRGSSRPSTPLKSTKTKTSTRAPKKSAKKRQ